jgi:hypothetical protein
VGEQAFPDGKAGELLAFQHQDIMPPPLQQGGGNRAGRAGSNDHDFPRFHIRCIHIQ